MAVKSLKERDKEQELVLQENLKSLQAQLFEKQVQEALPALKRLKDLSTGDFKVTQKTVTKEGDIIEYEVNPNHRIVLDANKALVDYGSLPKEQRVVHTGMIGFGLYDLSVEQLKDFIMKSLDVIDITPDKNENNS